MMKDLPLKQKDLIRSIAYRAVSLGWRSPQTTLELDISLVHTNGCPMDLERWLQASDFDFMHDVSGIQKHIIRDTGELHDQFLPRFHAR